MSKVWKTIKNIFWIMAIFAALLIIASSFNLFGYQTYIVKSGSMEPAIKTGSIVVNQKADTYAVGDVITFESDSSSTVTHRIVKIDNQDGSINYIVKGDANQSVDQQGVSDQNVNGKVMFSVPYLGYLIAFMRTLPGLFIFIIIPALIIISDEMSNIKAELAKIVKKRSSNE